MKIDRKNLESNLYNYSRLGHGLILGSPGTGKSHTLRILRDSLIKNNIPSLLIPVDRLGTAYPSDIQAHLEIDTSLSKKLISEYNNSENPAVLILDGFDAARNFEIQANLLNLIKDLISPANESWNILVSVRSFDAKKSKELLELFPKKSKNDHEFVLKGIDCEHFFIPSLTDKEVLSVKEISGLEDLFKNASTEFKEILRNPFNLWLLEKISQKDNTLEGLDKIGSEVQLLDKFWENYVSTDSDSDKKESILSSLSKEMVKSYTLAVKKDAHYQADLDSAWKSLLSSEIIISSKITGQRVSFSHNILFDHAVSRLIIDEDANELVKFLIEEPARALFLRPSLTYYFARLWIADRTKFWKSFSILLSSDEQNLRIFARLVPASVAVKLFSSAEDFDGLDEIQKKKSEDYVEIVTRILQAYDFVGSGHEREWLIFFNKLSTNTNYQYLWTIAKLTSSILDRTNEQSTQELCGEIGRNLLKYIWKYRADNLKNWLDGIGSNLVISIVAKTFSSNTAESEKLIRDVLEIIKEDNFPIQYLYKLADLVSFIWPSSPKLVGDIYRVIFNHNEKSIEATSMGTPVMPMTSHRRQDFSMCHYHLIRKYPEFLEAAPVDAIEAGIDALNAYVWQDHLLAHSRNKDEVLKDLVIFKFRNKDAKIIEDHSSIWDARTSLRDEQIKMADDIFKYLEKNVITQSITNTVLDLIAEKAEVAFWWKRLLKSGAKNPQVHADLLFDLCLVPQIVDGISTEHEAVNFIIASWPLWDENRRNIFQDFLMALKVADENKQKYTVELQKKIVSRLPKEDLRNEEALKLKEQIDLKGEKIANPPAFSMITLCEDEYTEEDYLKDEGTNIEDADVKKLRAAWNDVSTKTKNLLNSTPTKEQVSIILEKTKILFSLLSPVPITEDKTALATAWRELTGAVKITTRGNLEFNSDDYYLVKKILLEGAKIKNPWEEDFDNKKFTFPAYSPYAKTEVSQALPWLARFGKDQEILNAISDLINDPDPSVRHLVCREIWRMREPNLDDLWKLLDEKSKNEKNSVVLSSLAYSLGNTFYKDHIKGESILRQIYESFNKASFKYENIKRTLDMILWLHLESKNTWATEIISTIIQKPKENLDILSIVIENLLGYLIPKTLKEKPNLFHTAKQVIVTAIPSLWKDAGELYSSLSDNSPKEEIENIKSLYRTIDNIVTRLYFAADVTSHLRNKEGGTLSDGDRKEFYFEIKPILNLTLEESKKSSSPTVLAPTAHHFMELISGVLSYDVSGVLQMAADLMNISESSNYNLDSMAMSEVVKLTEATLADHRSDLQNDVNITNLLKLLDSFAKTGWSDALRLVWRLDEIYR